MKKKYGLVTAIAMVVGVVIGSGAFFKSEIIHINTGGNLSVGILAWVIGGAIMLVCASCFSVMATKTEKSNGIIDYAEAYVSEKYAYAVGWFMTVVYYPTLASVLSWLSAKYTLVIIGINDGASGTCLALSCFYLVLSYGINSLSPIIAGKIQVSTTVIKLIPLIVMGIVGMLIGTANGNLYNNFNYVAHSGTGGEISEGLVSGIVSAAFAYEGWIIATGMNSELKNARKNLPIALVGGSLIVISVYILYYIGLAGAVPVSALIDETKGVSYAFSTVFGKSAGRLLMAFIAISCLGSLNGVMMGGIRGMYSLAVRDNGPSSRIFKTVDKNTDVPANSAIVGVVLSAAWLFYFYAANLTSPLFGLFSFDSSELPVVTLYALYIPVFIRFSMLSRKESTFKRYVLPGLAVASAFIMILCSVYAHGIIPLEYSLRNGSFSFPVLFYLLIFGVIMLVGMKLK